MWIVGINTENGEKVALPANQCMIRLDMDDYAESCSQRIDELKQTMWQIQHQEHPHLPPFLMNIAGITTEDLPKITQEQRDVALSQVGDDIETMVAVRQAEVLVIYQGQGFSLKNVQTVETFDQVLVLRTGTP